MWIQRDGIVAKNDSKKKLKMDCFRSPTVRESKSLSEKRRGGKNMVEKKCQSMDLRSYFGSGEEELPRELEPSKQTHKYQTS